MSEDSAVSVAAEVTTPEGLLEMGGLPDPNVSAQTIMPDSPKKISKADIDAELAAMKKEQAKPFEDAGELGAVKNQGLSETEEGNGEGESVEDREVAPASAEKKAEKKAAIKNPFARARIVEKERNEANAALRSLQMEIAALRASQEATQGKLAAAQADPEEEAGPVEKLTRKLEKLEAMIGEGREQAESIIAAAQERELLLVAEQRIGAVVKEAPEVMEGAIKHLSRIVAGNARRQMPEASEQERLAAAYQAVAQKKIEWVAMGLDPAEQLYQMAVDFGWEPPEDTDEDIEEAIATAAPAKKVSAKEEIKAAKERSVATKSLGATPGRAVSNLAARPVTSTSDLRVAIDQLAGQGVIKKSPGRSVKFSEMAAAFGIKPVATR